MRLHRDALIDLRGDRGDPDGGLKSSDVRLMPSRLPIALFPPKFPPAHAWLLALGVGCDGLLLYPGLL
jgi:hypothetical protein